MSLSLRKIMTFLLSNQMTESAHETSLISSGYNLLLITPETQQQKRAERRARSTQDTTASPYICPTCSRDCHSRIGLYSHQWKCSTRTRPISVQPSSFEMDGGRRRRFQKHKKIRRFSHLITFRSRQTLFSLLSSFALRNTWLRKSVSIANSGKLDIETARNICHMRSRL